MEQNRYWLAGLAQIEGISRQEHKGIIRGELKFDRVSDKRLMADGESFLSKVEGKVVFLGEVGYPQFLQEINDPPKFLFYDGPLEKVGFDLAMSIVGTRTPSDYGTFVAGYLGSKLGKIGIPTISGLAYGIDKIVQKACMSMDCLSVGVLGEAVDVWQANNAGLWQEFKGRLILVSEYLPGTSAQKFTFPERNRIIAGLTNKTIIVEAAERSGALITADFAQQYEREIFAVPHEMFSKKGRGCNELIKNNKAQILTEIIDLFGGMFMGKKVAKTHLKLEPELQRIVKVLKVGNLSVQEIAAKLGSRSDLVMPSLTKLETIGILTKLIDGRYKISLVMK